MNVLRNKPLRDWTIVEYRGDGNVIVGHIRNNSLNGENWLKVEWCHHEGGNRTTLFRTTKWCCEVIDDIVFLHRTGEEPEVYLDLPWPTANLYMFVKNNHR